MLEVESFSTYITWSFLPAILSTCIHVFYTVSVKRIFLRRLEIDSRVEKKICRILALCFILLFALCKAYLNRVPSAFVTLNISGCGDPRIKEKYRAFIRANHPDKSKVKNESFDQQKAIYEILKDGEKCEKYDVFGLSQDSYNTVSKTEKECMDHFLMHSLLFYGSCFLFFFALPIFSRPIDELIEPLIIYTLFLVLEFDSIIFSRNGILGRLTDRVEFFMGDLALYEVRNLMRSTLVPCLLFCNQVRQIFSRTKLCDIDRTRRLEKIQVRLQSLVQTS